MVLVTDRKSLQYPKIVLGDHEIEWKKRIKYLVYPWWFIIKFQSVVRP